ncbi:wax ester/triacylglycerol synthase family O-acyltransferase [Actinomadura madurae]|uniref:wax ester/triacylglycerol synthase family O-acyltransferase n=1 Tax=Actinomadura madurae TaxID=1993 RepID=UPI0020D220B5|nr:wax ester/triacylglycerol synthase family O-acyltransferase [Actinomadura madurae]MCP9949000.1 wax ester/triacylglycerol synthase family O-acyltransferase [Actinomadura madurae]MCP9965772.1 wax ester/triacylglycerol synthase family O-acyltransferase [Actinomadura madurae]MCP9978248.1 wax ester/triacylglycerol synthase family O-acyltransferase [Actinomadura madurae]MCQ0010235.1 wax ester/triacylglycerol synthase family O-acyltransferase [Actinomadura madurae]MCQ0014452.1 wax ester/triacylgly
MNALDAGMFFAENDTTPLQIGTVAVFEGPAPDHLDLVRQVFARLRLAPRCLQRVRTVPFHLAHPVWVDDRRFAMADHVLHTVVPEPGGPEELCDLAGRILERPLDLTRSPWEVWLVEGLAEDRWALICKVHHCMVDGLAGIDLMAVLLDTDPDWTPAPPRIWVPKPEPHAWTVLRGGVADRLKGFGRQATRLFLPALRDSVSVAGAVPGYVAQLAGPSTSALNGPAGTRRRWARTYVHMHDVDRIRRAFGGSVNDVVLAAVAHGFRDLLTARGMLDERSTVRAMVPVSVRSPDERGISSNRVSAVAVELPCAELDPHRRLRHVRTQMDGLKARDQAAGIDAFVRLLGAAPGLLAAAAHTALRLRQPLIQTIVTNVPGPSAPLYAMGRRMLEIDPYIPITAGVRISIGVVSYNGGLSFGITGDHDAFPDLNTLGSGIREGIDALLKEATAQAA